MRRWLRLVLFALVVLGIALPAAGYLLHRPLVQWAGERAIERVERRVGVPLQAAEIVPDGWLGARVRGLRIGAAAAPLLEIREVRVRLDAQALRERRLVIAELSVVGPRVVVDGDTTLQGAIDALRDRARQVAQARRREPSPTDDPSAPSPEPSAGSLLTRLPPVDIIGGELRDQSGGLVVEAIDGRVELTGTFKGSMRSRTPALGRCVFGGDLTRAAMTCDHPLLRSLPGGLSVGARHIELTREPVPTIRVPRLLWVASEGASSPLDRLDGLRSGAEIAARSDADGQRGIRAWLEGPSGGTVRAWGVVGRANVDLEVDIEALDLGFLHPAFIGEMTARASLTADLVRGTVGLVGESRLGSLVVEDSRLADDIVGPFGMELAAAVTVARVEAPPTDAQDGPDPNGAPTGSQEAPPSDAQDKPSDAQDPPSDAQDKPSDAQDTSPTHAQDTPSPSPAPLGFVVSVSPLRITVGEASADAGIDLDLSKPLPVLDAVIDTGRLRVSKLPRAVPPGLMPNLDALRAKGRLRFRASLHADLADVAGIELKARLSHLDGIRIDTYPSRVVFERLRTQFETRFHMPDADEPLVRECGPDTARWTPLEHMPALLPAAVVAQEDGGFFKHGGVSLLHLRGSLIRNLRDGRFARGGSTLTMQLARNLYLHPRKTISRKLEEIVLAWLIEREFTKEEILTLYLNIVELGEDVFGIQEAAYHYFDKAPWSLTPLEIAWIVRLLPAPRTHYELFTKRRVPRGHQRSMMRLLKLLVNRGHLSPDTIEGVDPAQLWKDRPKE